MRKYELFTLISLVIIITIPILLHFFYTPQETTHKAQNSEIAEKENNVEGSESKNKEDAAKNSDKENLDKDNKQDDKSDDIQWGVDSATYTDNDFLGCVIDNYGKPTIWGRYLGDKEGVSAGLDSNEVKLLHESNIKILIIYNHVEDATGHDNGVEHAKNAIAMANKLGVPKGVAIFLDIEPNYPVDAEFIQGWYTTLADSSYQPAVYGVFDKDSDLLKAYNSMDKERQENTIVWTAYPQAEITTKEDAPKYDPQGPENSKLYGWQYGIEGKTCNIDTNLFIGNILEVLW
ncbi:glycoside hydrolase domain-containing protein [Ornithinibacillus bavariensis]|uniref:Rv2525c-like glycoside hydrolase-like domain-containing protein n=1 Tax=Ornithinibacillus bavariensis TaxID=545502 RepID=A0A919X7H7_9BACI|nr:glycoside hydrolase domain-containing protein [Ornithinibacillus bavariensis]GIO25548.1 hypothetical protein J43TS3_01590 [Ornithinibacillus bavariensis]